DQAYAFIVLELCERHGVRLEFVLRDYERAENGCLTPMGKLMFGLESWKSEQERHDIIERTTRGKRAKLDAGELIPQGLPPFGMRRVEAGAAESKYDAPGNRVRRKARSVRYEP